MNELGQMIWSSIEGLIAVFRGHEEQGIYRVPSKFKHAMGHKWFKNNDYDSL